MGETARALWAMLVGAMPILGAIAYWIVRPDKGESVE
ncbi:MAG: PLDc N-terminal domain-containing protein [Anaerolineales bacterium]|nr:PLDc N-terminal domain-containing protein [Anaerolineales bacterium]